MAVDSIVPRLWLPLLAVVALSVHAKPLPAWNNMQGNAEHTGFVPVSLDASLFRRAWQWTSPHAADGVVPFINAVTAEKGRIAVTDDDYFSPQSLYLLDEGTGALLWRHDFPADTPGLNPPTLNGNLIHVATAGHSDTFMHQFDAATGTLLWKTAFEAQWEHYLAPTVVRGSVTTSGGYYGGMYSFQTETGSTRWFTQGLPQVDMFTPAVSGNRSYVYVGGALRIVNQRTGQLLKSIPDPAPDVYGYSHLAAPMLTPRGRVITFSGDSFSGRASASTGGYYERSLLSFDPAANALEWRTASRYITQPAWANGVVYAGALNQARLDAIDESNGQVLWSWQAPDGSRTCRNVIATSTHVFVSTDVAVHAVNVVSRQSEWTLPVPGELALTDRGTLLINEGCRESTGRMLAIKLLPR